MLVLQGGCLQHEMLLLGGVHLVQVLCRHALRSVDSVLDHLLERVADTSGQTQICFR